MRNVPSNVTKKLQKRLYSKYEDTETDTLKYNLNSRSNAPKYALYWSVKRSVNRSNAPKYALYWSNAPKYALNWSNAPKYALYWSVKRSQLFSFVS